MRAARRAIAARHAVPLPPKSTSTTTTPKQQHRRLHVNRLNDTLPPSVGAAPRLATLKLDGNQLVGQVCVVCVSLSYFLGWLVLFGLCRWRVLVNRRRRRFCTRARA